MERSRLHVNPQIRKLSTPADNDKKKGLFCCFDLIAI